MLPISKTLLLGNNANITVSPNTFINKYLFKTHQVPRSHSGSTQATTKRCNGEQITYHRGRTGVGDHLGTNPDGKNRQLSLHHNHQMSNSLEGKKNKLKTQVLLVIIAPVGGMGGVILSYFCPHCNRFPLGDFIWWVSTTKKHYSWWCAICGARYEWRAPHRILVLQLGTNEDEATVSRAHAVPQGLCENLINALKLLANKQKDGDSPIQAQKRNAGNVLRTD